MSEKQPIVKIEISGDIVNKIINDDFVWVYNYNQINNNTVIFIPVEKCNTKKEEKIMEDGVAGYFKNKGFSILKSKYFKNSEKVKKYL